MEPANNPKLAPSPEQEDVLTIAKPDGFDLERFKSKQAPTAAGVQTLLTALPHHPIAQAGDFVRLHPDENAYWSGELCFAKVPIKGQRENLHLIEEDLAMRFLPASLIRRFRLALATKPDNKFFLCHVPTRNTDNSWVSSNLQACEQAKTLWTMATSRRDENVDGYKVTFAQDEKAFSPPEWPTQPHSELICVTFAGRMIDRDDHPGLLRLIGASQSTL